MPETSNRPLRVFLCHSSRDKPLVRELYQKLCAEDWIKPWLDEEELYPGQDWNLEIEKAVEAADVIFICLSKNSVNKEGYVQRELRLALDVALTKPEETIFVIPLRLEECEPPRRLRGWQYADYFPEDQRERAYQRLLVSLKRRADSLGLKYTGPAVSQVTNPTHPSPTYENKITLSNGMEFMRVPAGKFLMGSTKENKLAHTREQPQHSVNISYDYWMARFPVTNEHYNAYAIAKGLKHPVSDWRDSGKKGHPVVSSSWRGAIAYCQWLNDTLKDELSSGLVLRLPTEAEWEKAARWKASPSGRGQGEGEALEWPWGNEFDKNKCNSHEGGKGGTTLVGTYSPHGDSPCGCADMVGNAWEWTHSLSKTYPYKADDGREDENAPLAPVLRGGDFGNDERSARCAYRLDLRFSRLHHYLGFRVVVAPAISEIIKLG